MSDGQQLGDVAPGAASRPLGRIETYAMVFAIALVGVAFALYKAHSAELRAIDKNTQDQITLDRFMNSGDHPEPGATDAQSTKTGSSK